jgi:hypothetical protein
MKIARTILMVVLMAGWAAAQCGHAMGSDDKGKQGSADHKMSCCCCGKDMAKGGMRCGAKDAPKADEKGAAKSEAKSEDGRMAGGMGCCAKMNKNKDAAGAMGCCAKMGKDGAAGMSCGAKKDDAAKTETLPAEKMK